MNRNEARKAALASVEKIVRDEFPEVESVRFAGQRTNRMVAWSKNCCILAEESGRTVELAATNLCTALGYRRERKAEMAAAPITFRKVRTLSPLAETLAARFEATL